MNIQPTYFASGEDFRYWLIKNHATADHLSVGFYKVSSGKPSMTWSESVDEALCFGWIDGVRHSIDGQRYRIRFSPRKPGSIWSSVNIRKVENLIREGRMQPAGLASFNQRKVNRSGIYSYESEPSTLSKVYEKQFKSNKTAWKFFQTLAPSYQRLGIHRVMSAKQEKTRLSRLQKLIHDCEAGRKPNE